jgi:AcrR family transcriptional regulator
MPERNAARTRESILQSARARFASDGYDRATIRSIAGDAGVDAALVSRYFGSKEGLFAEAAALDLTLPDLAHLDEGEVADAIVRTFVAIWERDHTFVALLRTSAVNESAAAALRRVFAEQIEPMLERAAIDASAERASVWAGAVIGIAYARFVLRLEPLASMPVEALAATMTPMLVAALRAD